MKVFQLSLLAVLGATRHVASLPLDFSYKQSSSKGVSSWPLVNITGNEWEAYVGQKHIDLDVVVNECRSKRRPSPINLVANAVCMDTHEILTRRIKDTDCKMESLTFSVTPHTLRADFPVNDTFCQRPTIDVPNGYPNIWLAHHIEVHLRAEHVLDGRRYDGEMQMYHLGTAEQKRELAAVSVLLDASGFHDDARLQEYIDEWEAAAEATNEACGLGVVSRKLRRQVKEYKSHGPVERDEFFLEDDLAHLFTDDIESTKTTTATTSSSQSMAAEQHSRRLQEIKVPRKKMFPYNIWPTIYYYRYKGMITSPPCNEIVAWRVLDEPLIISRRQLSTMARLLADYRDPKTCAKATMTSETGENVRPLQELNPTRQEVVHCTSKNFTFWMYEKSKA